MYAHCDVDFLIRQRRMPVSVIVRISFAQCKSLQTYTNIDICHSFLSTTTNINGGKMIMAEIISYDADLICLQEVDASIHDCLIRPVLESKGYQGFYSNKVSV